MRQCLLNRSLIEEEEKSNRLFFFIFSLIERSDAYLKIKALNC